MNLFHHTVCCTRNNREGPFFIDLSCFGVYQVCYGIQAREIKQRLFFYLYEIRNFIFYRLYFAVFIEPGYGDQAAPVADLKPITFRVIQDLFAPDIQHRSPLFLKFFFFLNIIGNDPPLHQIHVQAFIIIVAVNDRVLTVCVPENVHTAVKIQGKLRIPNEVGKIISDLFNAHRKGNVVTHDQAFSSSSNLILKTSLPLFMITNNSPKMS